MPTAESFFFIKVGFSPSVSTYLRVNSVVLLLCPDPLADEVVSHGVSRGLVKVQLGSDVAVLDQRMVKMAVEASLDRSNVFQLRKTPHGDLLLAVAGALRRRHCSFTWGGGRGGSYRVQTA